jgi:hypothetical protein
MWGSIISSPQSHRGDGKEVAVLLQTEKSGSMSCPLSLKCSSSYPLSPLPQRTVSTSRQLAAVKESTGKSTCMPYSGEQNMLQDTRMEACIPDMPLQMYTKLLITL